MTIIYALKQTKNVRSLMDDIERKNQFLSTSFSLFTPLVHQCKCMKCSLFFLLKSVFFDSIVNTTNTKLLPEQNDSTKTNLPFQEHIPIACFYDRSKCNAHVQIDSRSNLTGDIYLERTSY